MPDFCARCVVHTVRFWFATRFTTRLADTPGYLHTRLFYCASTTWTLRFDTRTDRLRLIPFGLRGYTSHYAFVRCTTLTPATAGWRLHWLLRLTLPVYLVWLLVYVWLRFVRTRLRLHGYRLFAAFAFTVPVYGSRDLRYLQLHHATPGWIRCGCRLHSTPTPSLPRFPCVCLTPPSRIYVHTAFVTPIPRLLFTTHTTPPHILVLRLHATYRTRFVVPYTLLHAFAFHTVAFGSRTLCG